MSRTIACLAGDIDEAASSVKNAASEILASQHYPERASECLLHALTHLFNAEQLLDNAEQITDAPRAAVAAADAPRVKGTSAIDWAAEMGVVLGETHAEAMRLVTNELSTILAAARSSANDDMSETLAALEQLRTRCGVAADWASREQGRERDSEMRMRAAAREEVSHG